MWSAIKLFISGNATKLLEILGGIVAVGGVLIGVYESGKKAEKTDELSVINKESANARKIEDENRANLRDGDAAKQLQDHWS